MQLALGGRLTGGQHTSVSRLLDTNSLASKGLYDNGGELWFSIFADGVGMTFELKNPNIGIGFKTHGHKMTIDAILNGEKTGSSRNPWSRSANLRFPEGEPTMIVGRCVWGQSDDEKDRMEIYRTFNAPVFGPLLVEEPVCVLEEVIDQKSINAIRLEMGDKRAVDEIRIGPSLHSVLMGTKPLR